MRPCPTCKISLNKTQLYGETVDTCPKCHGIFFDQGELESILQLVDLFNDIRLQEEEIDTISEQEKQRKQLCPQDKIVMIEKEVGGITIDVCEKCQGIWLDDNEIAALKMAEKHIKDNLNLYIRLGQ